MVKFLNLVPWGGLYFCRKPGDVIDLEEDIAIERQKLGLGKLVIDKSKKVEPPAEAKLEGEAKVEAKAEVKESAPKAPEAPKS